MKYIDGFVIPVRTEDKAAFLDHARRMDRFFVENGATRVVEGWGEDVPEGKVTDFRRAVQGAGDEAVVFGWIEWPDKATRDAAMAKMRSDPQMMSEPMPFDGKRMIFGGFDAVFEIGAQR